MSQPLPPHKISVEKASLIYGWLTSRGGIALWRSANLSNPVKTWTTPLNYAATGNGVLNGTPMPKQSWEMEESPYRIITDPAEVEVETAKEVKRFHVAVRRGDQGLCFKLTDASSRKVKEQTAKAAEASGFNEAWYEFDYETQEAVIFVPDGHAVPLVKYMERFNIHAGDSFPL